MLARVAAWAGSCLRTCGRSFSKLRKRNVPSLLDFARSSLGEYLHRTSKIHQDGMSIKKNGFARLFPWRSFTDTCSLLPPSIAEKSDIPELAQAVDGLLKACNEDGNEWE